MKLVPISFFIFIALVLAFGLDNKAPQKSSAVSHHSAQKNVHKVARTSNNRSWGYIGTEGPAHWANIDSKFGMCKKGLNQSPVNIPGNATAHYSGLVFHYEKGPLNLVNNGHSIQVNVSPGSYIRVDGERYDLTQLKFHHSSEHQLAGKATDMEVQFIHKNENDELVVVSVLMERGSSNSNLQAIWDNIPSVSNEEIHVKSATINPDDLLPIDQAFYNYTGSLTTPPCTEEVKWFVMKNPISFSVHKLSLFRKHILYNARPVQALNGRF